MIKCFKYITNLLGVSSNLNNRSVLAKRNIEIAFFIKTLSILTSFILVPITLGYLKPIEYGIWMTLSSILIWINYFDIGLGNGLRNKLAESIAKNDQVLSRIYVSTTFFLLTIIIIPLIVILLILNQYLNWHHILNISQDIIPHLNSLVSILLFLFGIQFVVKIIGVIYIAHQMPVINDILNCTGQLLSLLYIYVLTLTTENDFSSVVVGFTIIPVLVYCLVLPYTFHYKYKHLRPSLKLIKLKLIPQLGGLSFQFFIIQMVCLILFSTSNLIISNLFGPESVTSYNIAFKYINVCLMVFSIILTPYWTAVTDAYHRKDFNWIKKTYKTLNKIWYIFIGLIILLITISKIVFKIWIDDQVYISYSLIISVGVYMIMLMKSNLYSTFYNGLGYLKIQLIVALLESVLYALFLYLLIPLFGLVSVPFALALTIGIGNIIYKINFNKIIYEL